MAIGIIGAMDEEVERLQSEMTDKAENETAGCLFIEGMLRGKKVVLLKSGIGKVNAAVSTTILHEQYGVESVINTGSAGGFAEELEVGDIVVSDFVTHHDVDVTAFDYAYGQVPGMPAMYEADPALVEKAMRAVGSTKARAAKGIIATGDSFMQDPERVALVRSRFPEMIAAEMEAAAIAQVCYKYGTPFVVLRALSDIAGKESSLSFDQFLPVAAENAAQMIMTMIEAD
ncbi:5'-methylthioadenosine/S-adenosylhomocysteine nucleosidase [Halobacillus litoralis]|uniref:5'-methylthioadenosine/S-adenosylhomocysteine nucleosidase n=1 Tax=Halobacillus litoralis TaxID=45668 RepID=UPI001CD1FF34|nr:5'-methylthioadenosine/S-adenosylhomocysteine nucleosidase [Halobacillus litoralis]MCA1021671.1 5'-methylthioadenosine/S-adenosylhomocysteine nucleosidase [Halobacillus litoralis]